MQIEEILVIQNDDISYGADTQYIDQILRVPLLLDLPLSPKEVRGLCAIGGDIIPAIDLNIVLGFDPVDISMDSSRILLIHIDNMNIALLVASITSTLIVDKNRLEVIEDRDNAISAVYKTKDDIVQLLDIHDLIKDIKLNKFDAIEIKDGNRNLADISDEVSNKERYLSFKMSDELFAMHIDTLREIIVVPDSFSDIAGSSDEIMGMVSLRDELLIIVDLRVHYHLKAKKSDKNRVLIIYVDDKKVGLIVDEILDIKEFDSGMINDMPANFQDQKVSGVIHADGQLISVINASILAPLVKANDKFIKHNKNSEMNVEEKEDVLEVVIFKLNSVEYAFNINYVAEIIDEVPTTEVVDTDDLIKGIINIRGQIVTIGSLYNKLSIAEKKLDNKKIIVCNIDHYLVGFFVDSLSGIEGVKQADISATADSDNIFSNVLHLNQGKRLVSLFDIDKIFTNLKGKV
jgi:purine-binding chemotaxis protein CheW